MCNKTQLEIEKSEFKFIYEQFLIQLTMFVIN